MTMRDRMGAVGCGAVALFAAMLSFLAAVISVAADRRTAPMLVLIVAMVLFVSIMIAAWWRAVKARSDDDEDLFHGERGMAMALIIVLFVAGVGFTLFLVLQRDFWMGALGR